MKRKLPSPPPPPPIPTGIKLIGINVGDNDFHTTFKPFVRLFLESPLMERKPSEELRAMIAQLFNDAALTFYGICQDWLWPLNRSDDLKQYLALRTKDVLFDEEVTDYLENRTVDHNGHFYYADIARGEVWTAGKWLPYADTLCDTVIGALFNQREDGK